MSNNAVRCTYPSVQILNVDSFLLYASLHIQSISIHVVKTGHVNIPILCNVLRRVFRYYLPVSITPPNDGGIKIQRLLYSMTLRSIRLGNFFFSLLSFPRRLFSHLCKTQKCIHYLIIHRVVSLV